MNFPNKISWSNWGSIFTKDEIWIPFIREICQVNNIAVTNIKCAYPGTNVVYIMDNKYVIKIAPPMCHDDYKVELNVSKILGNSIPIVPKILCSGIYKNEIDWPYLIMDYKPGEAIRDVRSKVKNDNLIDIYCQLAKWVKHIHKTNIKDIAWPNESTHSWDSFLKRRKDETIKELKSEGILLPHVLDEAQEFLDGFYHCNSDRLLLLNSDLTEDHLLLNQKDGQWNISALIDLADSRIGVREYEWVALWFSLLQRDYNSFTTFLNAYDQKIIIDDKYVDKLMAYTLLHQFSRFIIKDVFNQLSNPSISSFKELKQCLWW